MSAPKRLVSAIVGPGLISKEARETYMSLTVSQPLLLVREPNNPVDPNAVQVHTLHLEPAGYIRRNVAAKIAPYMDKGVVYFCKVIARAPGRVVRIWLDEQKPERSTHKQRIRERV